MPDILETKEVITPIIEVVKIEEVVLLTPKAKAVTPKAKAVVEEVEYICPLTVNYKELETLLNGKTISDYIGKNLPENEVKRIEEDFKIYQSIKK